MKRCWYTNIGEAEIRQKTKVKIGEKDKEKNPLKNHKIRNYIVLGRIIGSAFSTNVHSVLFPLCKFSPYFK